MHYLIVNTGGQNFNCKDFTFSCCSNQCYRIDFRKSSDCNWFAFLGPNLPLEGSRVDVAFVDEDKSLSHLPKSVENFNERVDFIG